MPHSSTDLVRHFETLVSPLESAEQPAWLKHADAQQRREMNERSASGRLARRQATEAFSRLHSLYAYHRPDLAALDLASITPQNVYALQQIQNLGESYPDYLSAALDDATLRQGKQEAYLATLREEYTLALISGQRLNKIGRRLLDWVIGAYSTDSTEFARQGPFFGHYLAECHYLLLQDDVPAHEVILLVSGPDTPCVAYIPGHPLHPLKEHASLEHFYASLRRELQAPAFQAFFGRFIALRHRQMLNTLALDTRALPHGLRAHVAEQMGARLLADARYLTATTVEQVQTLTLALPDFGAAVQRHLLDGAGAGIRCGEENEGGAPSDWISSLHWVRSGTGQPSGWIADLSGYRQPEGIHPTGQADPRGLYEADMGQLININEAFYHVSRDDNGHWRIQPPRQTGAYSPRLHHNGAGAWHHEHEHPQRWSRLSLLRRLGPISAGFDDERLLQLGRVSGVDNTQLRRVYQLDQPVPALLHDVLVRARIQGEVAAVMQRLRNGQTIDDPYRIPQVKAFYEALAEAHARHGVSRVRRGVDDPAPARDAEGECPLPTLDGNVECPVPLPHLLTFLDSWEVRLHFALANHLYELAQIPADNAVLELQRRYPMMPLAIAQRFVDDNRTWVAGHLQNAEDPLPMEIAEQALVTEQEARLCRALEGFIQPGSAHEDTLILAIRLLEYLDGWRPGTTLILRREGRFGQPMATLGQADVESPSLYRDDDEGWFATHAQSVLLAQDLSESGFYRAVLLILGPEQCAALGFGQNEPERLHQRLREMALARPARSRLLLGMDVPRTWLSPPQVGAVQREPDPTDDLLRRESARVRLTRLQVHTPLWLSDSRDRFLAEQVARDEPIGPLLAVLEEQQALLASTLVTWVQAGPSAAIRAARANASDQLRYAWEARLGMNAFALRFDNADLDQLPPLPCPLPAVNSLRVADLQNLDNLPAFLRHLPTLGRLELNNLPLQELPAELLQLRHLRWLDLSRIPLPPLSLIDLGQLPVLETLVVSDQNNPSSTWNARYMQCLLASGSIRTLIMENSSVQFQAGVFAVMARAQIEQLNLNRNLIALDEQSVRELADMVHLRALDLSRNLLQNAPDVSRMVHLQDLDLSRTGITRWPTGLEHLTSIQDVSLEHLLIGDVPEGAGSVPGLRLSGANLQPRDRDRFRVEMQMAGNLYDSDESSHGSGSDLSSGEDEASTAEREALRIHHRQQLLEGMSTADLARADPLLAAHDSSSVEFFDFLVRIDHSHAASTPAARIRQRIQALIRGAFNHDLRRELYGQAQQAITCVDRDALVFSQMENMLHADQAMARAMDGNAMHELIAMGTSHWRSARLEEYVQANTPIWSTHTRRIDSSEISFYFRMALTTRLGLRDQPTYQRYKDLTGWVTANMLDAAYQAVVSSQAELLPVYLNQQPYWRRFVDFTFRDRIQAINRWRDSIGQFLDAAVSNQELPRVGEPVEHQHLHSVLMASGLLALGDPLPTSLQLDSAAYVRAYQALVDQVERARLELTEWIVSEPQPGPSRLP
ncbi:NEL-type E3 ubiquitin ligase domain-containing protein [Pseudomonas sp. dw_358]|uniref:NEL-type E3 ubiquitin ligase domain-containing protein n=1 Tax=Pseudomonas sp. dw_358 TaxID=2720083 RepID=UPI001BD68CD8|nr:NEL-type E3 ubiquitin ligase domain-containing protein [Pseudomonas sp. dw_358]